MNHTKAALAPDAGRTPKPVDGFDGAGHMDPERAEKLRELARAAKRPSERPGFVASTREDDELEDSLAGAALVIMTSGEDELPGELEAEQEIDEGGPFIETSASTEFAGGIDESNTEDALREPFPIT